MFFYKNVVYIDANKNEEDYLFGYLQIAEVFLILYEKGFYHWPLEDIQ